jgi:hypothetical protein
MGAHKAKNEVRNLIAFFGGAPRVSILVRRQASNCERSVGFWPYGLQALQNICMSGHKGRGDGSIHALTQVSYIDELVSMNI